MSPYHSPSWSLLAVERVNKLQVVLQRRKLTGVLTFFMSPLLGLFGSMNSNVPSKHLGRDLIPSFPLQTQGDSPPLGQVARRSKSLIACPGIAIPLTCKSSAAARTINRRENMTGKIVERERPKERKNERREKNKSTGLKGLQSDITGLNTISEVLSSGG